VYGGGRSVLRGGAQLRLADLAADKGGADAAAAAEAPKLLRKKAQGQHVVRHGLANGDAGRAAARCAPARRPGKILAAAAPGAELETITAGVSRPQPLSKAQQAFHRVAARQGMQVKTMVSQTVLYIKLRSTARLIVYIFPLLPKPFRDDLRRSYFAQFACAGQCSWSSCNH